MSAHDRYRSRLAVLAGDELPAALLGRNCWRRSYGRFTPESASYATLVYERDGEPQELVRVDVFERCPEDGAVAQADIGWLRLERFPVDPRLTTLPAALAGLESARVVRYRPGRRCTVRVEGSPARYVKVFPDDRGARVHAEAKELYEAARRDELRFAVARPLRLDRRARALWQEALPGAPLAQRLDGALGPELAKNLGAAAASLTRSGLRPSALQDAAAQLARTGRAQEKLQALVPESAPVISPILEHVRRLHGSAPRAAPRPIHGAPHLTQWLEHGGRLGLVDFDRHGLGDAELDAATIELSLADELDRPDLHKPFRAAYEEVAGPLRRDLLRAYGAQRRVAKALTTARAIHPDGDRRALRRLERLLATLTEETP